MRLRFTFAILAAAIAVIGAASFRLNGAASPAIPALPTVPRFETAAVKGAVPFKAVVGCNPVVERVQGNAVWLALHLRRQRSTMNNPADPAHPVDQLELRSYSGCLTSPLIDVKPGTALHIDLHNDLSKNDPTCASTPPAYLQLPPGVGCFNTTNLHTHGLHVSPSGNSDNVLLSVGPGTVQHYEIDIPADHPSGTFWYHAHMHGSTAVGLASADAGVLIVRGNRKYPSPDADIDTILHGADGQQFPERVFVLQQIAYACFWVTEPSQPYNNLMTTTGLYQTGQSANANSPWTCHPNYKFEIAGKPTLGVVENFDSQLFSPTIWDTNGRFTSINGAVQPEVTVPAGQIQRWRFVHAGIHDTINLQLVRMSGAAVNALAARLSGKPRAAQAAIVQQACTANASTLTPQFEIAADGLTRTHIHVINPPGEKPIPPTLLAKPRLAAYAPQPLYPSNYLQPGYRSDVLVVFPKDGEDYCLLDQAAPPSERVNPVTGTGGGNGPSIPQLLAYVHVRGGHDVHGDLLRYVEQTLYAGNPQLPSSVRRGLLAGNITPWAPFTTLPAPPSPLPTAQPYVHFQINDQNGNFTVNGQPYDPNTVQKTFIRKLGAIEDWDVMIEPQPQPSPSPGQPVLDLGEPHIFHIHVNPFEVVDVKRLYFDPHTGKLLRKASIFDAQGNCRRDIVDGDPQHLADQYCGYYHTFRDTLFIENSYEVTLRTHYVRYTGEFVLHCHILDHEDAGMMANVMIVTDPKHPPKPGRAHMPAMSHERE